MSDHFDTLAQRVVNAPDAHQPDPNVPRRQPDPSSPMFEFQCRWCHVWYIPGTLYSCHMRRAANRCPGCGQRAETGHAEVCEYTGPCWSGRCIASFCNGVDHIDATGYTWTEPRASVYNPETGVYEPIEEKPCPTCGSATIPPDRDRPEEHGWYCEACGYPHDPATGKALL